MPNSLFSPLRRIALLAAVPVSAVASGISADGASARSRALGGVEVAGGQSAVDALAGNPAGLMNIRGPVLELGAAFGTVHGEFSNRANDGVEMNNDGLVPHGALAYPVGPLTLGVGVITDAALCADWRFRDAPGGLDGGTSYGFRTHKSEIGLLRFALGASYEVTPQLALGASVGLLYNRNRLEAPYIIQTQPQLAGAKTLLDLETEGWGWGAQFGVLWKPLANLQLGLSYTLPSRVRSEGRAFADAQQQLKALGVEDVDTTATFDAEVTNSFPQSFSAGLAWQVTPRLALVAQADWINWSDAFDTLDVRLRHVDNELYRTLMAGKSNLDDDIPLRWRDQWVLRCGAEYAFDEHWTVRAGYRYARNPVPADTLTPTTAAISEHVVSAGVGGKWGRASVDLAWQWQLPQSESVSRSALLSGEYNASSVEVSVHWLTLTTAYEF